MGGGSSSEIGGFRIFKVQPGSPAAEGGLEVFFDFIIEVNGHKMEPDQKVFFERISENENKKTKLVVFNVRTQTVREVMVMPRQWGGAGLLGSTVRYDTMDSSENSGIRVLEVFPNSPAAHAGLTPFKDYLLGTMDVMFRDLDELVELVQASMDRMIQIYVYNSDTESIREVQITPSMNWGGEGSLGCDIGTGLLHRIPPPRRQLGTAPPTPAYAATPGVGNGVPMPPHANGAAAPPLDGLPIGVAAPPGVAVHNIQAAATPSPPVPAGGLTPEQLQQNQAMLQQQQQQQLLMQQQMQAMQQAQLHQAHHQAQLQQQYHEQQAVAAAAAAAAQHQQAAAAAMQQQQQIAVAAAAAAAAAAAPAPQPQEQVAPVPPSQPQAFAVPAPAQPPLPPQPAEMPQMLAPAAPPATASPGEPGVIYQTSAPGAPAAAIL